MFDYDNALTEIGYDLSKEYWGKGYATEAITALIDYAFKHLKWKQLWQKLRSPISVQSRF